MSRIIKIDQQEFWEDPNILGIEFPEEIKEDGDIEEGSTFFKEYPENWGSGIVEGSTFSKSNGNFPFWQEGEVTFLDPDPGFNQRYIIKI